MKCVALLVLCLLAVSKAQDEAHGGPHAEYVHEHTSSEEHYKDGEHNPEYDHQAFAGSEANDFRELSPEESKAKLRTMVLKIDTDGNGKVTRTEMSAWITKTMKKYIYDDVDQQWKNFDVDENNFVTWVEYKNATYGYMDGASEDDESYQSIIERDQRRFKRADEDRDELLSREEFLFFLHPEESVHMKDLVIDETLDDLDKDKDGFLSINEYIGEISPEEDGSEPEWVASEREQFNEYRDANKDGKLDKEEVGKWIIPPEDNHAEEETKHLFDQADKNKDDELSIEEIVDQHEIFVGSQATNYGSLLHEEL